MTDLLTWQALRGIADLEAYTTTTGAVYITGANPRRPQFDDVSAGVWARGMMKKLPDGTFALNKPKMKPVTRGAIVHTRVAWKPQWRAEFRRQLIAPCVLVSAFHDRAIDESSWSLFTPDGLQHWFGVQVTQPHPQITHMPIGVEPCTVPALQAAPRAETRDILLYCNFGLTVRHHGAAAVRGTLWQHFATHPWVTARQGLPLLDYATDLGRAKFVLSPPGNAWDCYRTYDAIAMGAIPIVKRHGTVSDVHQGWPVLTVDSWTEVTPERLQTEWERRGPTRRLPSPLTCSYWAERIQTCAHIVS